MYTPRQLAAFRAHPDRPRLLTAVLDAHDALVRPTATTCDIIRRVRVGNFEMLFGDTIAPVGGLTPGVNPAIIGGRDVLGNPLAAADEILNLLLVVIHEGVRHLDVDAGRARPSAVATTEERFFTELHAYTAEFGMASANRLTHLLAPEFRNARHSDDVAASVLTVESQLVLPVRFQSGAEQRVVRRVGVTLPTVPHPTP